MVLGGTAVVIVGPVLRGKDADLAGDVGNNIFVDLFGIGEATLPGEEPHEDGEAEAGGPLALTGEQDMLVWSERPRFFEPPVGRLSPHVPLAVVTFGASIFSGRLTARLGPRWPMVAGSGLASLGSLVLLLIGEDPAYPLILANLLLVGFGGGLVQPSSAAVVLSSAPGERTGVASAVVNASRQVGGVLGVALLGSLVAGGSFISGLHLAGYICAGTFLVGAVLSFSYLNASGKASSEQA